MNDIRTFFFFKGYVHTSVFVWGWALVNFYDHFLLVTDVVNYIWQQLSVLVHICLDSIFTDISRNIPSLNGQTSTTPYTASSSSHSTQNVRGKRHLILIDISHNKGRCSDTLQLELHSSCWPNAKMSLSTQPPVLALSLIYVIICFAAHDCSREVHSFKQSILITSPLCLDRRKGLLGSGWRNKLKISDQFFLRATHLLSTRMWSLFFVCGYTAIVNLLLWEDTRFLQVCPYLLLRVDGCTSAFLLCSYLYRHRITLLRSKDCPLSSPSPFPSSRASCLGRRVGNVCLGSIAGLIRMRAARHSFADSAWTRPAWVTRELYVRHQCQWIWHELPQILSGFTGPASKRQPWGWNSRNDTTRRYGELKCGNKFNVSAYLCDQFPLIF